MQVDSNLLRGTHVYLVPLSPGFKETLRQMARDERIWEGNRGFIFDGTFDQQFDRYFATAMDTSALGGQQAFVIHRRSDHQVIGMTRMLQINHKDKTLEIGYTWYLPAVWGQVYNKECKLLMLAYTFEMLQFNRVQFNVAGQNTRSQKAVEKIGAVKEGVLRKHGYRNDGSIRDTVIFSIIDDEWMGKKEKLLQLISEYEKC